MEIVFILGVSQAFFFAFLILRKNEKMHSDIFLCIWLIFQGLHLLGQYARSAELIFAYPHLLGLDYCFPMLLGPFTYIYISLMVSKNGKFKPVYLLHMLPFLAFMIYFLFDFYLLEAQSKLTYYLSISENPPLIYNLAGLFNINLGPVYILFSFILLRRHTKNIANNFSYTENINFSWLRYLLIGMTLIWSVVFSTNLFPVLSLDGELGDTLIYLTLTIVIFYVGYFGIKQQVIYTAQPISSDQKQSNLLDSDAKQDSEKYKKSGLKPEEAAQHLDALLHYMKEHQPYLDRKLALKQVAQDLNISTNHLSQVINEKLEKNFFDFVNAYRVDHLKEKLAEDSNNRYTILSLAYDSGFNSKSSFNSAFKKFTGYTPSQYLKLA